MENLLNVTLIQSDIVWENREQNITNLSQKIDAISESTDIIVLQEMFTTGYTLNAKLMAETMEGKTVKWMLKKANEKDALILGSIIVKDNSKFYNRLIVAFPKGKIQHYDKRHLFTFANEDKIYSAGRERMIIEYKGWKLAPLICYDLRFPVWSRNTDSFDALIYIANWPHTRISAWDTLLKARAIENLCYVIGVNRLGVDANRLQYIGHSAVYDTMGNQILRFEENMEGIKDIHLEKSHLVETRKKFSFLNDRDHFEIQGID